MYKISYNEVLDIEDRLSDLLPEEIEKMEDCVCTRCKGTYIRYSRTEEDFCCWDCGSKDYEEKENEN